MPKLRQKPPELLKEQYEKCEKEEEEYITDSYYQNLALLNINNIDEIISIGDTPIFKKTAIPHVEFFYHHDHISVRVMREVDDFDIFKIKGSTPEFNKLSLAFKNKEPADIGCFKYSPYISRLTITDLDHNQHSYSFDWVDRFISEMRNQCILN